MSPPLWSYSLSGNWMHPVRRNPLTASLAKEIRDAASTFRFQPTPTSPHRGVCAIFVKCRINSYIYPNPPHEICSFCAFSGYKIGNILALSHVRAAGADGDMTGSRKIGFDRTFLITGDHHGIPYASQRPRKGHRGRSRACLAPSRPAQTVRNHRPPDHRRRPRPARLGYDRQGTY